MEHASHAAVQALSAVIDAAANLLRVPIEEIRVESLVTRDWPDSCLGLGKGDEGCADVVTPGFLVVLGDGFHYRTDMQGNIRRQPDDVDDELLIDFQQSGGIGGWTSSFLADDSTLSPDEAARIRGFIDSSDFFELAKEVSNGHPITDMYDYTLTVAHGRRHHTVHTYDGSGPHESPALVEFIGWLKEKAPTPGPSIEMGGV